MVAYIADSTFEEENSVEVEKSWHLLTILIRLGHPIPPSELAARCNLFCASTDLIERLCSLPGSPLYLTRDRLVTMSLTALSTLEEFKMKLFLPSISFSLFCSKRTWEEFSRAYFRKRKGSKTSFDLGPKVKRRLSMCPDRKFPMEPDETWHTHSSKTIVNSSLEGHRDHVDVRRPVCFLPELPVTQDSQTTLKNDNKIGDFSLSFLLPNHQLENVVNSEQVADQHVLTHIDSMPKTILLESLQGYEKSLTCYANKRNNYLETTVKNTSFLHVGDGKLTIDRSQELNDTCDIISPLMVCDGIETSLASTQVPADSFPDKPSSGQKNVLPKYAFTSNLQLPPEPVPCGNTKKLPRQQKVQHKKVEKYATMKQKLKGNDKCNISIVKNTETASKVSKNHVEPKSFPSFESFTIEDEEGSGGYGTVYRAQRKIDGKTFAIKCPHANAPRHHVNNELKVLQRFGGKNFVIKYEGSFKDSNSECFILEHVDHDRPEVLKKDIDLYGLQWYGYCLFRSLASLHKQGIVHRDVKPGNFLFSRKTNRGYLIDFNLAIDLHQKYRTNSKSKSNLSETLETVPISKVEKTDCIIPKKTRSNRLLDMLAGDVKNSKPLILKETKRKAGTDYSKTLHELGNRTKYRSQGAEASGITSTKDGTSTLTPSAERLKEPLPCKGRKELINLVHAAMISSRNELITIPVTQRKRVAAPGKVDRSLFYLTPMPLHSNGICIAGAEVLKNRGDGKHRREGPCVGTKGFRAPEVLIKSIYQGCKVDTWSAGVTLLYLIIGRTPFVGDPEQNIKDIVKLKGSEEFWELAKLHNRESSFPADLFDIQSLSSVHLRQWCEMNTRRPEFLGLVPDSIFDLIDKCLTVNPRLRISAEAALHHEFFLPCHESLHKHRLHRLSLNSESSSAYSKKIPPPH